MKNTAIIILTRLIVPAGGKVMSAVAVAHRP